VAGEVLRGALGGRSLSEYLAEQLWQPAGMEAAATWWLESPDGIEIGGSGFSAVLRDYGRFGLFVLNDGVIEGDSVLPAGWVRDATLPFTLPGGERVDYGYFWWPGTSASARRDGAFSAEGIHGQFLYINPAVRGVIVVWSAQFEDLAVQVVPDAGHRAAVQDRAARDVGDHDVV
jgi:CubicO group peptidase (beta-lactamase class C family)